jgi:hypothetical protein
MLKNAQGRHCEEAEGRRSNPEMTDLRRFLDRFRHLRAEPAFLG